MRTDQVRQTLLMKAYLQEPAQRQVGGAAQAPGALETRVQEEIDAQARIPRELSKGKLLDIYG